MYLFAKFSFILLCNYRLLQLHYKIVILYLLFVYLKNIKDWFNSLCNFEVFRKKASGDHFGYETIMIRIRAYKVWQSLQDEFSIIFEFINILNHYPLFLFLSRRFRPLMTYQVPILWQLNVRKASQNHHKDEG